MTRRKQYPPNYVNHKVTDEVGRIYRVCLSTGGTVLVVGRRCNPGGRERVLNPDGPKARWLVAKLQRQLGICNPEPMSAEEEAFHRRAGTIVDEQPSSSSVADKVDG